MTLHLGIFALILHSGGKVRVRNAMPGSPKGVRIELSYLPGAAAKPTVAPVVKSRRSHATAPRALPALTVRELPELEAPASAASASATSGLANDALGTDDIRIALTTYSPSPKPDLSRLPHGLQGDVVLDVTIDPTGKVADLQILHALGYGIEGTVAEAVRGWKFSPATKDGVPVASVQELHFHYGPV